MLDFRTTNHKLHNKKRENFFIIPSFSKINLVVSEE